MHIVLTLGSKLKEQPLTLWNPVSCGKGKEELEGPTSVFKCTDQQETHINFIHSSWAEVIPETVRGQRCNSTPCPQGGGPETAVNCTNHYHTGEWYSSCV